MSILNKSVRTDVPSVVDVSVQQQSTIANRTTQYQQQVGLHTTLLYHSRAGRLYHELDKIKSLVKGAGDLQFPQLIVVGDENTGKSSLLEGIAMLPFFPRNDGFCTRMPIKLVLKHLSKDELPTFCAQAQLEFKEDGGWVRLAYESDSERVLSPFYPFEEISIRVKEYMHQAVKLRHNGALVGVIEDILVIEVYSTMVPNLVMIDLPGIVGAQKKGEPDDLPQKTEELVFKYLKQEHTLVLAVASASDRLRNSRALGLLLKSHKEEHAIGVLTMPDKVVGSSRADELLQRINGKSADSVEIPLGYVTVKNRDSSKNETLGQATSSERAWFDQHFPGLAEDGKATTQVLIQKLAEMMCNYVEKTWTKKFESQLVAEVTIVSTKISELGCETSQINLLEDLISFSLKRLFTKSNFRNLVDATFNVAPAIGIVSLETIGAMDDVLAWMDSKKRYFVEIERLKTKIFWEAEVTKIVSAACSDNSLPLKISRFTNFTSELTSLILSIMGSGLTKALSKFEEQVKILLILVDSGNISVPTFNTDSRTLLQRIISEEIFIPLWKYDAMSIVGQLNLKSRILEESCADERRKLKQLKGNLESALVALKSLSQEKFLSN